MFKIAMQQMNTTNKGMNKPNTYCHFLRIYMVISIVNFIL
jgi:hypothetical protein